MWLHHLFSFFGTVLSYFITAIGTTIMALVLGILFACATALSTMQRIEKQHGRDAMLKHWEENAKIGARLALACATIIYGPIFLWKTGQAMLDDHNALVARSRAQRAAIATDSLSLSTARSEDLAAFNKLRISCAETAGSNLTLQSQNRDQQGTINNCQTQAIKLISPPDLTISHHRLNVLEKPQLGDKAWVVFLVIPNKVVTPVRLTVVCDKAVTFKTIGINPLAGFARGEAKTQLAINSFRVDLANPEWSPKDPLTIGFEFDGSQGNNIGCSFDDK